MLPIYRLCVCAFFLFSERFEHTQRFFLVFGKSQTKSLHKHYRHTSPLYIPKIYDTHGGTKMLCREMESPLSIIRFVKIWKRFLFYFAVISNRHTRWKTQSYTTGPCIWQWQCHFLVYLQYTIRIHAANCQSDGTLVYSCDRLYKLKMCNRIVVNLCTRWVKIPLLVQRNGIIPTEKRRRKQVEIHTHVTNGRSK